MRPLFDDRSANPSAVTQAARPQRVRRPVFIRRVWRLHGQATRRHGKGPSADGASNPRSAPEGTTFKIDRRTGGRTRDDWVYSEIHHPALVTQERAASSTQRSTCRLSWTRPSEPSTSARPWTKRWPKRAPTAPCFARRGMAGAGFEPAKAEPTRLQRVPFDRSGTPPGLVSLGQRVRAAVAMTHCNLRIAMVIRSLLAKYPVPSRRDATRLAEYPVPTRRDSRSIPSRRDAPVRTPRAAAGLRAASAAS